MTTKHFFYSVGANTPKSGLNYLTHSGRVWWDGSREATVNAAQAALAAYDVAGNCHARAIEVEVSEEIGLISRINVCDLRSMSRDIESEDRRDWWVGGHEVADPKWAQVDSVRVDHPQQGYPYEWELRVGGRLEPEPPTLIDGED